MRHWPSHATGHPGPSWAGDRGYQVMGYRLAVAGVGVAFLWYPAIVLSVVGAVLLVLAVLGTRWAGRTAMYYRIVKPIQTTVGETLGWTGKRKADWQSWLELPKVRWQMTRRLTAPAVGAKWVQAVVSHWAVTRALAVVRVPYPALALSGDDAKVVVRYPRDVRVGPAQREEAETFLTARLPGEWEMQWEDGKQRGTLRHPKRPPSHVEYDPTEATQYDVFNVPIGQTAPGEWYVIPLARLAPHTALSAPTGYSKTTTLQSYIAHVASRGARVLILDPKRRSFRLAFGDLRNISILTTAEAQSAGLASFTAEMIWRYEMMERFPALDLEDPYELMQYFTPWFIVIDEKATLAGDFRTLWRTQGNKGRPIQEVMQEKVLNLARAALMHQIQAFQQGNAPTFGGTANRDNHMCRIASGPQSGQAWQMMFPGHPRKKVPAKKGRAVIGIGYEDLDVLQLRSSSREVARAEAERGAAILERDEAERNRRIEEVTGMSLEELGRPVPDLPGSAETWVYVPGRMDSRDAIDPYPTDTAIAAAAKSENEPRQLTEPSVIDGEEAEPGPAAEPAPKGDEFVYGIPAAAEFLDMSESAFRRARTRHKGKHGGRFPGEASDGKVIRFRKLDLREWQSQRPVAGARN